MSVRLCTVATCRREDTGRVIYDSAFICAPCTDRTRTNIAALPAALRELGVALAAAGATGQRVTGTPAHPLPIRVEVAELRHEIRAWLVSEVHMWRDELALTGWPATSDAHGLAMWLCRHVEAARAREWADTTHDAAKALRGRARALCDLPRDKACFPVGPCPDGCGGHVWAQVPADLDEAAVLVCNTCGRVWHSIEWHRLGRRMGRPLYAQVNRG